MVVDLPTEVPYNAFKDNPTNYVVVSVQMLA